MERVQHMPVVDQGLFIETSVSMETCLHSVRDRVLRRHLLIAAADLVDLTLRNARPPQRPAEWPKSPNS